MLKIFKSKQVVTVFAIILCFGILLFAYKYRVDKAINAVSVPVAAKDLLAREQITEESFTTVKVAQSMLSKNVITNKNVLVGGEKDPAKYVNYNTFIPKGSMFYQGQITTWDHMPDSAWADIEEGNTVISLGVDVKSSYGNSIYPGDKIDLFFKSRDNGKFFMGPLIQGITVLAVKDPSGNHIFKRTAEQKQAGALIFSVPDEEFLYLKAAFYLGGEIVPVPRNADYNPEKETSVIDKDGNFINNFIRSQIKLSPGDVLTKKTTDTKTK